MKAIIGINEDALDRVNFIIRVGNNRITVNIIKDIMFNRIWDNIFNNIYARVYREVNLCNYNNNDIEVAWSSMNKSEVVK